jgi:hypothetical protein
MKIIINTAATLTEIIRGVYMGGAHHAVGSLSRKRYTQYVGHSTLDNNQRDTGVTQETPEGTYTDEDKEGSVKARMERLEDIHNWRG